MNIAANKPSLILRSVWNYRGYIAASVQREFQTRYRNSLLGGVWSVLNPLAMITVYTVIFSQLMHARLAGVNGTFGYSIYLCAGVITWGLFSEILSRCQTVFLENANLIKKLNFPRLCLPITTVLNAWINFFIVFGLFLLFLALIDKLPGWPLIGVLPLLIIQTVFAAGLGITLGVLNVFFRDIGHLFGIVLQFWFWFTPVIYPLSALPAWAGRLVRLNPMTSVISAYQAVFVTNTWPVWSSLWPIVVLSIVLCYVGLSLFRNHVGEMVDEL